MTAKEQTYKIQAAHIIEKLKLRGIEGFYCKDKAEALEKAKAFLTPGTTVTWGGSETIREIGLRDWLPQSGCVLYDRAEAKTEEEKRTFFGKAVTADYFLMSTNAITLDGELVNIDGAGNRVACLIHGPEHVLVIAGMNKVSVDVEDALKRVKNIASPPNTIRLGKNTPCANTGRCAECLSDDCICCQVVVTRMSRIKNRIKVILVGEELGF